MSAADAAERMDVILYGGPLDGFKTDVAQHAPEFDVWLFRWRVADEPRKVLAYAFSGRSTAGGKRWVLNFLYEVAREGAGSMDVENGGEG